MLREFSDVRRLNSSSSEVTCGFCTLYAVVWKFEKFSLTIYIQKFREINLVSTKNYTWNCFHGIFSSENRFNVFPHCA